MVQRFESECLTILKYLDQEGYPGLEKMEQDTGISTDELRRYLLPFVKDERPRARVERKLDEWREKNPWLYVKVVENAEFKENTVILNTSKHDYFLHYAKKHDYRVTKTEEYPYISVIKKSSTEKKEEWEQKMRAGRYPNNETDNGRPTEKNSERWSVLLDE